MTAGASDDAHWEEVARQKLSRLLGPAAGSRLFNEIMGELQLVRLSSADELARFADRLGHRDGFVRALGTVLKTHAILRGGRIA